jgi:hypothetical protein
MCCDGNSGDSLIVGTVDHDIGNDAIRVSIDEFEANVDRVFELARPRYEGCKVTGV